MMTLHFIFTFQIERKIIIRVSFILNLLAFTGKILLFDNYIVLGQHASGSSNFFSSEAKV